LFISDTARIPHDKSLLLSTDSALRLGNT